MSAAETLPKTFARAGAASCCGSGSNIFLFFYDTIVIDTSTDTLTAQKIFFQSSRKHRILVKKTFLKKFHSLRNHIEIPVERERQAPPRIPGESPGSPRPKRKASRDQKNKKTETV
jgi:hypothetical protein